MKQKRVLPSFNLRPFFLTTMALICLSGICTSHAQIISTIAGTGTVGFSGDGGLATAATLNLGNSIITDRFGNIYFSDHVNLRVRKINTAGIITTVAGNGSTGFSGDGVAATASSLYFPCGITVDSIGNLYIADRDNYRVRKVDTFGIIWTIAGTGASGYAGDGGPATTALLNRPGDVKFDAHGNLFIADNNNNCIRMIDPSGIITTYAGTTTAGFGGDGGPATAALINAPGIICFDNSGNMLFTDLLNARVRIIDPSGIINTFAGNGTGGHSGDGGPATAANINPYAVAVDGHGNYFISDAGNNCVRKVNSAGIITTYAGTGILGFAGDGGPATAADLNSVFGIALDNSGDMYIVDGGNDRIREVSPCASPILDTIAGTTVICVGSIVPLSDDSTGGVWSSSATAIGTVDASGNVTAISTGTTVISYAKTNGCGTTTVSVNVTVNPLPFASPITGTLNVCAGSVTTLSDASGGGTWSSTTTGVGTVDASGNVTGITSGTTNISYTVVNSCGTAASGVTVTVNSLPFAGSISGASTVCPGATVPLTDGAGGGTWSSVTTAVGTIDALGNFTGITLGSTLVSYTVTNSCGTAAATVTETVSSTPSAGTITGPASICTGFSTSLSDLTPGGVWSATNGNATVTGSSGAVNAITAGLDTIMYTVTAGCGTATDSFVITLSPSPVAGTIGGLSAICVGSTTTLSETSSGGVWTSMNSSIAGVGITSGVVSGASVGTTTISYTVTNSCGSAGTGFSITVETTPTGGIIYGPTSLCIGSTITVGDATTGGSWSTPSGIISIDGSGDVTAYSAGSTLVSYTVINSCGYAYATYPITVVPFPDAGTILGTPTVCATSSIILSDASAGGTWSLSGGTTASVGSATGMVRGSAAGFDTVTYTVTNMCGTATSTFMVTVDPLPHAGTVTGAATFCRGAATTMADTTAGGIWATSGSLVATIGTTGILSGLTTGSDTVLYTTTNMCGSATAKKVVTVIDVPVVDAITGLTTVCTGATIALSDASSGGVWGHTNSAATVAGGTVTGVSADTVSITYSVTNMCGITIAFHLVTVNTAPSAGTIIGDTSVCPDHLATLIDTMRGGTWTISNGHGLIDGTGVFAALSTGMDTVTYTVTNECGTGSTTFVIDIPTVGECDHVGVNQITQASSGLEVFPNPNIGTFSVKLTSDEDRPAHITLFNMMGEKVREFDTNTNTANELNLNTAAGIYLISATTQDGSRYDQKVIVK
jgi:Secretion system C-terminal sorting domain